MLASTNGQTDQVLVEDKSFVKIITLNRPKQLNALSAAIQNREKEGLFVPELMLQKLFVILMKGCRAILLDKDKNPKWEPSKIESISDEMVDRYFTKIDDDDEWEDLKLTVRSNFPAYAIAKL